MKWYEFHILKQLSKDAVKVNKGNKKIIDNLKRFGYVDSLGVAPKGPAKGKECVLINDFGVEYWNKMKKEQKEDRKFWIAILMNPISAIIGAIAGFIISNFC